MAEIVQEFFGLLGLDTTAPMTLLEFFPWFMSLVLGFCVIAGVLQLFRWAVEGVTRGGRNIWS